MSWISYTVSVTNDGTTEDTFQVVVWDQDWPMEFSANQVTLASGRRCRVLVTVTVPIAVDGGEEDAVTSASVLFQIRARRRLRPALS